MNRSKQSGFIGIAIFGVFMVAVGLAGLIGNHPPRHDTEQQVSVCKMNGSCTTDQAADSK